MTMCCKSNIIHFGVSVPCNPQCPHTLYIYFKNVTKCEGAISD